MSDVNLPNRDRPAAQINYAPLLAAVFLLAMQLIVAIGSAHAAGPWESLVPFKKIDADPANIYPIAQSNGPWLILAYTFRGDKAEDQARQLTHELRAKYKLTAYTYEKTFDYSKPERGIGFNPDGTPKTMRYQQSGMIKEVAVLVGDYDTIDDPKAQATLAKLKKLSTASLSSAAATGVQTASATDAAQKGPMAHAIVVTNPLLPHEFFASKGVDKFVLELNRGVQKSGEGYSLLDCPGKFSIQVATFSGSAVIDPKKVAQVEHGKALQSKLASAGEQAHELTTKLRQWGFQNRRWDAYEFHDRDKSIVCVGSFDSLGRQRPDGGLQLDPAVQEIVNTFGNDQAFLAPNSNNAGKAIDLNNPPGTQKNNLKPAHFILFDIAPKPIEVPRRSIGADYQRSMRSEM